MAGSRKTLLELFGSCLDSPILSSHVYEKDDITDDDLTQIQPSDDACLDLRKKKETCDNANSTVVTKNVERRDSTKKHLGSTKRLGNTESSATIENHAERSQNHKRKHDDPHTSQSVKKSNSSNIKPVTAKHLQTSRNSQIKEHSKRKDLKVLSVVEEKRSGVKSTHKKKHTKGSPDFFYGSDEFNSKKYGAKQVSKPQPSTHVDINVRNGKRKKVTIASPRKIKNKTREIPIESPDSLDDDYVPNEDSDDDDDPDMSSSSKSKKKVVQERNTRFSLDENTALIENLIPHFDRLQGHLLSSTDNGWKNKKWREITQAVNSVGQCKRTVQHVKKRLQDIKRDVKRKISEDVKESQKTGNMGVAVYFKPYEDLLRPYIDKDCVVGIEEKQDTHGTEEEDIMEESTSAQMQNQPETLMLFSDKSDSEQSVTIPDVPDLSCPPDEQDFIVLRNVESTGEVPTVCPEETVGESTVMEENIPTTVPQSDRRSTQYTTPTGRGRVRENQRTICRTRNADREQFAFDQEQSQKFHDAQVEHRESLMERLDNITKELKIFNSTIAQHCITLQLHNSQLLIYIASLKELLGTIVQSLGTCRCGNQRDNFLQDVAGL